MVLRDQYNVLCLGLSGAGKSTLLAQLVGEPLGVVEPTTGFNIKTLPFKDTVLSIKELGGSCVVQPFWDHYFGDKHGILFVVNAASSDEDMLASKDALTAVFADHRLKGKPCLVMGTHSDLKEARSPDELEKFFGGIMQQRKWALACCSAHEPKELQTALETLIELMAANSN